MSTFDSITSSDKVVQNFGGSGTNGVSLIISKLLPFIYAGAGLYLLVLLILGGITLMTAAGDQGKMKQGYGQITAGLIGFVIIFVSYFIAQIVQIALGIRFL